jgi:hypothetical protein
MPADLHVHFRVPAGAAYTRKLKQLAAQTGTTANLAARTLLIACLSDELKTEMLDHFAAVEETLAEIARVQRDQAEELKAFRAEFKGALRRASGRQANHGGDGR